jgi:hypothetical protein
MIKIIDKKQLSPFEQAQVTITTNSGLQSAMTQWMNAIWARMKHNNSDESQNKCKKARNRLAQQLRKLLQNFHGTQNELQNLLRTFRNHYWKRELDGFLPTFTNDAERRQFQENLQEQRELFLIDILSLVLSQSHNAQNIQQSFDEINKQLQEDAHWIMTNSE